MERRASCMARRLAHLAILAAAWSSSCARNAPPPRISGALDAAMHGVVAVATTHDDGSVTLCSGAMVAPNLVLTARHCVAQAITAMPACDSMGRSHNGAHLGGDLDPSLIGVYVGPHVSVLSDAPRARGVRTVHPSTRVLCDADVAFVVLDRNIDDVTILPMRLEGPIETGDWVVPVGFGGGRANQIGTRMPRGATAVLTVGPGANSHTGAVLGPHEFEVDTATCRGDSGGPAIDIRTGEIVGVVSRGGSCEASGNHVYTRVDSYSGLAQLALAVARTDNPQVAMRK